MLAVARTIGALPTPTAARLERADAAHEAPESATQAAIAAAQTMVAKAMSRVS